MPALELERLRADTLEGVMSDLGPPVSEIAQGGAVLAHHRQPDEANIKIKNKNK